MIAVRWCAVHRLVLEEAWEGLSCPAGHNWFIPQKQCHEYWIVDMEFPEGHERFCVWKVRPGSEIGGLELGAWYRQREAADLDITCRSDYLEQPSHWARTGRHKKREVDFLQREVRGANIVRSATNSSVDRSRQ